MYQEQPLDLSVVKNRVECNYENETLMSNGIDYGQCLSDDGNNKSPKSSNGSQEVDIVDILLSDYYNDISNEFSEPGQELDKMIKMDEKTNNENLSSHDEIDSVEKCKLVLDENKGMNSNMKTDGSSEYDTHFNTQKCKDDNNSNKGEKETSLSPKRSGQSDLEIYQNKSFSTVSISNQVIKNEKKASFISNQNQDTYSPNKTNLSDAEYKRFQQIYFNLTKQYKADNLLQVLFIYSETDYVLLKKCLEYFQVLLYHIFFGLINDNSVVLTKQVLDMFFKMLDMFSIDNTEFWTGVIRTINCHYGINYGPSQVLNSIFN